MQDASAYSGAPWRCAVHFVDC